MFGSSITFVTLGWISVIISLPAVHEAFVVTSISRSGLSKPFAPNSYIQSKTTGISSSAEITEVDKSIVEAEEILVRAAESKNEDSDVVYEALSNLEKIMRQKAKEDPNTGLLMQDRLDGDWRLIFTTGTKSTQDKYGKVNYFPLKAVQSFRTKNESPMTISNGIYVGDLAVIKFFGTMDFDLVKRKLEFDFDEIVLFGFIKISLGKGDAAKIGASSGLGSESNVENSKRGNKAFFNWISANDKIATARGGGGGLALWKRI